ncbi:MAG: hypothetical protein A2V77_23120 [Anaeromyxobacter sp. RBG_16_69_14]|nr:MAG: hypothetical protein A2V77_23120 [Anaeromyxobacter sp. RBG_16_69_14]
MAGSRAGKAMTASHSGGWAIAAVLLLGACWFPKDRGQRLEERVERVEGESAVRRPSENRGAAEEQARRIDAKIDAKMAEVQSRINELNATVQQAGTERSARNDKLAEEMGRLRAMLEGHAHRLDAMEKSVAQLHASAGARVSERKAAAVPERKAVAAPEREPAAAPEREAVAAPEVPKKREASEVPQGKTSVLALARQQEASGEKAVARDLYQEYVSKFPADPRAAQAHFRLGELAFGDRRYQEAIVEYGRVAKDFPRSDEAPDALLRTAEAMTKLDLKDDAVAVLSEIPKRYPASSAATRAKQRLTELTEGKRKRR